MAEDGFQRARSPERKAERRAAILAAARELLEEGGPDAATLSAIAARAGVVKSGLYRYFESREEILIHLLIEGCEALIEQMEHECAAMAAEAEEAGMPPVQRAGLLAAGMAEDFAARPMLCQLISIMAGTLERNISAPTIRALKLRMHALNARAALSMVRLHGGMGEEAALLCMRSIFGLCAGLWPMCNPGPRVAEALESLDLPGFGGGFEPALRQGIHAILLGADGACADPVGPTPPGACGGCL